MTSLIQSKYLRYDLQAVLLPGLIMVVTVSSLYTGSLSASLFLLKDISISTAAVLLVVSFMVGKFIQAFTTLGFEQKYWKYIGHPKFRILPERDKDNVFLSQEVKCAICKKIARKSSINEADIESYLPIIKERCYELDYIKYSLHRLITEAHMYRAFRLVFPLLIIIEISFDFISFPYGELGNGVLDTIWSHFPFARFIGSTFFFSILYIISWGKYNHYTVSYYRLLYSCYANVIKAEKGK